MRALQTKAKIISAALLSLTFAGCAGTQGFTDRNVIESGVIGKSWGSSNYLETSVDNPDVNPAVRSFNSFDFVGNTSQAQLAVSFYDHTTSKFIGYGRLYDPVSGWSPVGPNFAAIASGGGTDSLDFAAIAAQPGGLFSAFFMSSATANTTPTNFSFSNYAGTWDSNLPSNTGLTPLPFDGVNFNTTVQSPMAAAYDKVGRAYAIFRDTSNNVRMVRLSRASGVTPSATILSSAPTPSQQMVLTFDGVSMLCGFFLAPVSSVLQAEATCLNTNSNVFGTRTPLSSSASSSIAAATDGNGKIVVVFVQQGNVYATFGTAGSFSAATQLNSTGLPPIDDATNTSVGVAYLGNGSYLATWLGGSGTLGQVYSSTYTTFSGWQAPLGATFGYDNQASYAFSSLSTYGNGNFNAGIAVRYNDGSHLFELVARYQTNVGWLPSSIVGNGCTVSTTSPCNHRSIGVIFPSGNAAVVFPDQDPSGTFRVAGVEFK